MKLRLRLLTGLALLALVPAAARAQTRVTGQVTDANTLRPLTGAQVVVKGTSIGVLTDTRGRYALAVPAGRDSLAFTYLGYGTVTRAVAPVVNVSLQVEAVSLAGVVVTALGIEREKRTLTFSAQAVSGDRLAAIPTSNALSALEGEVAGIKVTQGTSPGGASRIVIRGAGSITGNNQPLIVVDGIPIDNSTPNTGGYGGPGSGLYNGYDIGNAAQDVNPNDVQSVTVLKGPNAAALYGARAANGAIVVQTKSGRGLGERGWGVTATIGGQFQNPLRLPDYQNQYGQGFYGEFQFVDGNFGGLNDGADESWGPKLDGRKIDQFFGKQQPWVAHPDNVRSLFNTGVVSNLNIAVARSSERNNVRFSVGRWDENGMYPTNRNLKTDIGLNGGLQISNRLSTEVSVDYVLDQRHNMPGMGYDETNPMQGFVWFGRQVDMKLLKQNMFLTPENNPMYDQILAGNPQLRVEAALPYSWNYSYHPNPYWMAMQKQTDFSRNRVLGHAAMTYKFNDWFSVTARTGRDWYQNHMRTNVPVNTIGVTQQLGGLTDVAEVRTEMNSDLLATINRSLTKDLTVTVNGGGNARQTDYNNNYNEVDQLVIPGVYTMQNSDGTPTATMRREQKRVNSLYGSANATYKGWLSLDLTGRNDWSSTLPQGANSFFYPSVGGAFVFSDALGIRSNILTSGKLRASWTRVGNDTDPYQLQPVYAAGTAWGGMPGFTVPNRLPNAKLRPEQTTGQEVGADLGFLNDRVVINATLYQKSTKDQIFPVAISTATGFTSSMVNSGEMRNRGIELEANITPVQLANGFRWNVVANWSKNTNRVMSLYGKNGSITIGSFWNINVTADTAQPYGNLTGTAWKRDAQGRIVVGNVGTATDGLPVRDSKQTVLGNYNPNWVGGITNTFSYKAVSLSVLFDGQKGGNVYSVTRWFGQYSGVLQNTLTGREQDWDKPGIVVPNSVHADGTPNTTHVTAQDYWHNTFYSQEPGIIDASYLKLRDARLSFQIPSKWVQRAGFSQATFSLVGHNLFLWAKQATLDPETAFDASNTQGIENGQFPSARQIGFTLSVRP